GHVFWWLTRGVLGRVFRHILGSILRGILGNIFGNFLGHFPGRFFGGVLGRVFGSVLGNFPGRFLGGVRSGLAGAWRGVVRLFVRLAVFAMFVVEDRNRIVPPDFQLLQEAGLEGGRRLR